MGWLKHILILAGWLVLLSVGAPPPARAVIVLGGRDGDGNLDDSGTNKNPAPFDLGQYEGSFGGFLGTPIAPRYFVTASHIGDAGNGIFTFDNGTTTTTTYHVSLAGTQNDLAIWRVNDGDPCFSLVAPLYTSSNEVGNPLVVLGNGTTRGSPVTWNDQLVGWQWGDGGTFKSWGTGTIGSIAPGGQDFGDLLRFTFDRTDPINLDQAILSVGDSGGPVFVQDPADGVYKLAGINSLVDAVSQTPNGSILTASLFDARGFYDGADQITGPDPVPLGSYATRISSNLDFIGQTTDLTFSPPAVPEPSSLVVLAIGIVGGLGLSRALASKNGAPRSFGADRDRPG
ncbi:MAG: PEP-CTERM sorting domain-containing protein [Isosphaeraceae bacterium]|nr:PEP-CTERM sorting domain-containing protein [Isosphaeraceae bacterium]